MCRVALSVKRTSLPLFGEKAVFCRKKVYIKKTGVFRYNSKETVFSLLRYVLVKQLAQDVVKGNSTVLCYCILVF